MQFPNPRRRARPRPVTVVNLAIASLSVIIIAAIATACGGNDGDDPDDIPTISAYDFRLEMADEGIKQVRASDTPPNTPQFSATGATATPQLSQDPAATGARPPQLEWAYFTRRDGEPTFYMAELPDFHVVTVTGYHHQKPPQFTVNIDGPSGIRANETVDNAQEVGETIALWLRNYEFVQRNGSRQRILTAETINNAYIAGYQNW